MKKMNLAGLTILFSAWRSHPLELLVKRRFYLRRNVMDEDHINRFNESRSFLYLAGYLTDAENERVKRRFKSAAERKGVKLVSQPFWRSGKPFNRAIDGK